MKVTNMQLPPIEIQLPNKNDVYKMCSQSGSNIKLCYLLFFS